MILRSLICQNRKKDYGKLQMINCNWQTSCFRFLEEGFALVKLEFEEREKYWKQKLRTETETHERQLNANEVLISRLKWELAHIQTGQAKMCLTDKTDRNYISSQFCYCSCQRTSGRRRRNKSTVIRSSSRKERNFKGCYQHAA